MSDGMLRLVFVAALLLCLAVAFNWRAQVVREAKASGRRAAGAAPSRLSMLVMALGLVFLVAGFLAGPDSVLIQGNAKTTAVVLSSLSWTGVGLLVMAGYFTSANWLGVRLAGGDATGLTPQMHYGWFVVLGLGGVVLAAATIVWAIRSGILVNGFELFAAAMASVLVLVLALFFQKTRIGRALRAVADDHAAALSVGISLRGIWVIVWAVAGIVALAAGIIWGGKAGVQFSLSLIALKALPVLILGGFTSVPGAIVGGLIIGVGEKVAEVYWSPAIGAAIENWFAYVLALAFLLFRPQGLFGERIIERV
ncbi:MAG: branched-chain amino acid ABC transporter permease [Hyphomicrobiaceae bacterium]|nr:MAG: branched-chain amino acid ABC transporter permease [Hyphomicrobiaceae bacterium]